MHRGSFWFLGRFLTKVHIWVGLLSFPLPRKQLFTSVHYFIHLNLAIALFLGYATFVAGIEYATEHRVCHRFKSLSRFLSISDVCLIISVPVIFFFAFRVL